MKTMAELQQRMWALSQGALAQFCAWLLARDQQAWDEEIRHDVAAGSLDALAERALQEHADGLTTPL
ncbi:MAG: hypothetical protein AB7P40_06015 [Chloroflexota bacterium]